MSLSKSAAAPNGSLLLRLWHRYELSLETRPLTTKALTSATLSYCGDVVCQTVFEKKPHVDHSRALRFAFFGVLLTPLSHFWYIFLEKLFARMPNSRFASLMKLALDQLVFDPFLTTFFFVLMGLMEGQSPSQIRAKLARDLWPTQKMSWRVWPLAQWFNFNFVAPQFRVLFGNLVGFFWGIYMAFKASN